MKPAENKESLNMHPFNTENDHNPLVLTARIPMQISAIENSAEISDDMTNSSWLQNEELLSAILLIEEHQEESHEFEKSLHRMDAKLNLILNLLSQSQPQFPLTYLRLETEHLHWYAEQSLPVHSKVIASLYISPSYPVPLQLPGEICKSEAMGEGFSNTLRFKISNEKSHVLLEKYLFKQHRKTIANKRDNL